MIITAGHRLGPYEILNPVGSGGMGEVYRAKDTRLNRTVAIKVLPPHLSSNPERRERFEREARAVSAINHPYICTLHDIGHHEGIDFLVMEYIEGETLLTRLQKGPLPLHLLLQYSMQIADALDKAHKKGIVHRDLKPGNIILTKAGIKLLDFGLAKVRTEESSIKDVSSFPTEQKDLTQEGVILGTIQYMSPEQLEGKAIDARTDIFAFGAVVYEMATGKKAFEGTSQATIIAAILKDHPRSLSEIQPLLPSILDRLIQNCLAKDADDRWQTAHDVLLELRSIEEGFRTGAAPVKTSLLNRRELFAWILAGLLLCSTAYLIFFKNRVEAPSQPITAELSILPPPNSILQDQLAISPDGRKLVFVAASSDGTNMLWLRELNSTKSRALSGTEGAYLPFWSPDGRHIGFFAQAKLKILDTDEDSAPQALCDALQGRGASWSKKDEILFAPTTASALYRISAKGGNPRQVTKINVSNKETGHRFPHFLPDAEHFFYVSDKYPRSVWIGSLKGETKKLMDPGRSEMMYSRGKVFFVENGTLFSQTFDLSNLQLSGERQKIGQQLAWNDPYAFGAFSVSQEGILTYITASEHLTQLAWYNRSGTKLGVISEPGHDSEPELSLDGEKFAFFRNDLRSGSKDIWIGNVKSNTVSRLTFELSAEHAPVLAPDGRSIIYVTPTGQLNNYRAMRRNLDGSEIKEIGTGFPAFSGPTDWSSDGKFLSFVISGPFNRDDIFIADPANLKQRINFANTQFDESDPQFSRNGRYIAYTSDESGRNEVYIQPFPQTGAKWQVSLNGGHDPHWRGDDKELFFFGPDGKLMTVLIDSGPNFHAGTPQPLFFVRVAPHDFRSSYAVTSDGQRFLVTSLVSGEEDAAITVLMNFGLPMR